MNKTNKHSKYSNSIIELFSFSIYYQITFHVQWHLRGGGHCYRKRCNTTLQIIISETQASNLGWATDHAEVSFVFLCRPKRKVYQILTGQPTRMEHLQGVRRGFLYQESITFSKRKSAPRVHFLEYNTFKMFRFSERFVRKHTSFRGDFFLCAIS